MPDDELNEELGEPEDESTGGGRFSKVPLIAVGIVVAIVVVVGAHGLMASGRITTQTATTGLDDDSDDAQNRASVRALEVSPISTPTPTMPSAPVIAEQAQQTTVLQSRPARTPSPDEQWAHEQLMLARQAPPMVKAVHDHSTLEVAQSQQHGDLSGSRMDGAVTLHPPAAPYSVMAGSIVPALLITGINSDIPGPDRRASLSERVRQRDRQKPADTTRQPSHR